MAEKSFESSNSQYESMPENGSGMGRWLRLFDSVGVQGIRNAARIGF